ncbi:efflux RND transporter periplasmic adaptor subunit [Aromatoleum toluclasticum]|uniref:efflux RND transporter periplasmic adaptor subunit n=1 Tax=Aromatoleum toluclasticum TaxID=92003 RepID=UPI001D1816AB|nr:efflux RND transporter periplasmic adaptor subunit [Aromatoleum toluclasticum]MCC4115466.1 efflux RND transporter periplasmic adaptor subunit [Aromatoleum toluclasticum]
MTATPAPKPRRLRRAVIALVTLGVLGAGGWFVWNRYFAPPDEMARYQFATVTRGDIEDVVTATGTLQPRDYVDVGAQVSGQLKKIHVEVGSEVKAGELLAEIDPVVLQSRVDATRAQLRNLRAQLMDREASRTLTEVQVKRQRNLMAEDATTRESLQNAEAALQSAQAQVEAIKAQIDQTESNLRADEANLNYARIYAPMSGTVVSITARQGQTLIASQQAPVILRVADLSTMTVQTQVSEADVSRLRLGMDAYFTILGGEGRRWEGKLRKIEPTPVVQNNVVLFNALFDVANPNQALMTQMTAQVFFVVAAAKDTLLVPMSALAAGRSGRAERVKTAATGGDVRPSGAPGAGSPGGDAPRGAEPKKGAGGAPRTVTVKVAPAEGPLQDRQVEIGVRSRIQAQVLSGLEEGERIVSGMATADKGGNGSAPRRTPRI